MTWKRLGSVAPTALAQSRLDLHYAVQLPAALGIARGRPEPDFGHHALTFEPKQRALVSAIVPARKSYRAAMRFHDRVLVLLDERGESVETLELLGRTLRECLDWLSGASARFSGDPEAKLDLPAQELPKNPLAGGARFGPVDRAATAEIEAWFADVAEVLARVREGERASPVRVWSHHFDLDKVLALGGERTIGLGLSPGDEFYAEPYLYVLPSSYPEGKEAPELEQPAIWRTMEWTGAVLLGSAIANLAAEEQAAVIERFFRSTAARLRPLVGS